MNTNHNQLHSMNNNTCEASTSTITLRPEEEFNPQYCTQCDQTLWSIELMRNHLDLSGRHPYCRTCRRGFLNNNSFKTHLILSDYHHYCDDCDKEFQSSSALKIHYEQSTRHHRDYEEGDRERRAEGWEDELARQQQQEENREVPVAPEKVEEQAPMSRVEVGIAVLNLKKRLQRQPIPKATVKQTCPVCLCPSSKMRVTKCGHVFCSSYRGHWSVIPSRTTGRRFQFDAEPPNIFHWSSTKFKQIHALVPQVPKRPFAATDNYLFRPSTITVDRLVQEGHQDLVSFVGGAESDPGSQPFRRLGGNGQKAFTSVRNGPMEEAPTVRPARCGFLPPSDQNHHPDVAESYTTKTTPAIVPTPSPQTGSYLE
ncbi:hypothetical protein EDD85DRAFT_957775 [Armillaria nabsnona]|nr:hypothetical protein EDD85DRAFT_957775 [Armillaria nabsnona]